MKESLRFGESLIMDGVKLKTAPISGKLIGEVLVEEFNPKGDKIFSETTINDVTLPGSIFVLEKIFNTLSSNERFLHPNSVPVGTSTDNSLVTVTGSGNDVTIDDLKEEYVFGFMVGNGGESATGLVASKYNSTSLISESGDSTTFLPIRKVKEGTENVNDNGINYYLKCTNGEYDYYYIKGFTGTANINTVYADGSGSVSAESLNMFDNPILTYAEVILEINSIDLREYFDNDSTNCYINQLGLVAGKPKKDDSGDFEDIKLITTLNFKSKDLSNNENRIKFTYKVYCL